VLKKYVVGQKRPIEKEQYFISVLEPWVELAREGTTSLKETNIDIQFLDSFFAKILGYILPPTDSFTLFPKRRQQVPGVPDFRLGQFEDTVEASVGITRAVGELKGPGTDLDKIDLSRGESPVQQAFRYGTRSGLNCHWVIVSNMDAIRLYRVNSELHFEEFKVASFIENGSLTEEFWTFYYVLGTKSLNVPLKDSPLSTLLATTISRRIKLTDAFYKYYRLTLSDALDELVEKHPVLSSSFGGKLDLAKSAQKLLHRGLMICFMSDHPARLLSSRILDEYIQRAREYEMLGDKVYPSLQALFKYIDRGNLSKNIFGYDGGLFSYDEILDRQGFTISDNLFSKPYDMNGIKMDGIFGFREIDFYNELSPHLLGRLFEYSIADQEEIFRRISSGVQTEGLVDLQSELGIVYTREVLASFAARSALEPIFHDAKARILVEMKAESVESLDKAKKREFWNTYLDELRLLRIVDLSVGSGAFLVECYQNIRREAEISHMLSKPELERQLTDYFGIDEDILDGCLFGKDILPGAISVAELALWLASARKDTKLTNFQDNFLVGDSLGVPGTFPGVAEGNIYQEFDLVIGNPPWGGDVNPDSLSLFRNTFPTVENPEQLNTFELFLYVGLKYLKEGGRLCYILPHALLNPKRRQIRKFILESFEIEKLHYLGADWFGSEIRMNTTMLQIKKTKPGENSKFISMMLTGDDRRSAIRGDLSLEQLEASLASRISQSRCRATPDYEIQVFRYENDDEIMTRMEENSLGLASICFRSRGVELNKAGLLVQCPFCFKWIAPPRKALELDTTKPENEKIRRNLEKKCIYCKNTFKLKEALAEKKLIGNATGHNTEPYIDGDGIHGRYRAPIYRRIELNVDGVKYKGSETHEAPKVLIRQAGVGLAVCYDEKGAYCPRSVYIYRPSSKYATSKDGVSTGRAWKDIIETKFLLGVLNSRLFHYFLFKRYGEIDAAQAFSKVNHEKLADLPIPVLNWEDKQWQKHHSSIVKLVDLMLGGARKGGKEDWEIELILSEIYGLNATQRQHIMGQFGFMEYHKTLQELFPDGKPPRPDRYAPV
jgi:type I restriction-modification system DNA methylase subunit